MPIRPTALLLWLAFVCGAMRPVGAQVPAPSAPMAAPPVARVEPVRETHFGSTVADDYRYMENLRDPYVAAWFKGQSDYSRAVLDRIPGRKALMDRIAALDSGTTIHVGLPEVASGYYVYAKRGLKDRGMKVYVRSGPQGTDRLLVDPDAVRVASGAHSAIDHFKPSPDGGLVAYGISSGGSENSVLYVVDSRTGKDTGVAIDRTQFDGVGWLPDNKSFVYTRLAKLAPGAPATEKYRNSRVYLHRFGTDTATDRPIFGVGLSPRVQAASEDIPFCRLTPGAHYVLGELTHGALNERTLYIAPIDRVVNAAPAAAIPWIKVCDVPDAVTDATIHGDDLFLLTHRGASRFKIVRTNAARPNLANVTVVLPPGDAVITTLDAARDALYVTLRDGGIGRLRRIPYGTTGGENVSLPLNGTVQVYTDPLRPGVIIGLMNWTRAYAIYTYDPKTRYVVNTGLQPTGPYDAPADLVTDEVKVTATDGTRIPLSIVHKRGLKLDGSHPTWLDGYGAYGISEDPSFNAVYTAWMERGGIRAIAHIRGGGEYGEDWHLAGKMRTKPNTWNDFIACAQYLVDRKYTSPAKLAGSGSSAGGIAIGRAITARPDLFGAACIDVGVTNTLRWQFGANGIPNIPEFGDLTTSEGFAALKEMDAVSHVQNGVRYPAVLVVTGINDPRVDSWQSAKMAARLQAATTSGKPVMLRVDYDAGHGIGSTKQQRFEFLADEMAFFLQQSGDPDFQ